MTLRSSIIMLSELETTPRFEQLCYDTLRARLEEVGSMVARDVYVLSCLIHDEEDDPTRPTLTLGFNTLSRLTECTPSPTKQPGWPVASDALEAKWNYAFWLHNELCVIGRESTETAPPRNEWISSLLDYYDKTQYFVDLCVRVARRLHRDRVISRVFGRPIPIVVHELEYSDKIAHQTSAANPDGVADEFVDWVLYRQ